MRRLSYIIYHLSFSVALLTAMLLSACSNDSATENEEPLPEGMGRIRITICTPEANPDLTRAVNTVTTWLEPDHDWEKLHSFRILIFDESYKLVDIIERTNPTMTASSPDPSYQQSATVTSDVLDAGTYHIYATANCHSSVYTTNEAYDDGFVKGKTYSLDDITNMTMRFTNGYSEKYIPMTGKLASSVTVAAGETKNAGTITVWRVIGKLQFEFTNEADHKIQILGVEVEPINQASSTGPGIYLFSKDDLTSEANLVPMFANEAEKKGVTATWPLNTSPLQTTASVSMDGVFQGIELTYGNKLEADGVRTAGEASLYKFKAKEALGATKNADAFISFKVTPKSGMTFTPKNLTFNACRGGTNEGYFDVEVIGGGTTTTLATGVRPERYSVSPYLSTYSYPLSGITGEVEVRIYVYNLAADKDYAFGDVAISGDVTNNTGSALQEFITLPDGSRSDVGTVVYQPAEPLVLNANGTGSLFFYVNETDATYTTTNNQLSLRFKIKRQKESGWYDDEIRFGVSTHYSDGTPGHDGFNVIRRNDWIHIPVHLTDWQFRVEPLAFVPIAGYPAKTLSSDALTATFNTGGMIALQPFVKKYNDPTWLDFDNSEVTLVDISWQNSDGRNVSGNDKIVKTAFTYVPVNKCIIGELNNSLTGGPYKTTFTVNVKLGPSGSQYDYSFTCNVILQIPNP